MTWFTALLVGCTDTTTPTSDEPPPPLDTGCDGRTWFADADGDLFGDATATSEVCWPGAGWVLDGTDCDDADPSVHPGQHEIPGDGVDQDCDEVDPPDFDQDGFDAPEDCDDADPNVSPSATDVVGDALDQNCDGVDGTDLDGDAEPSLASGGADCDDAAPAVNPAALELALNGLDDDCDGLADARRLSTSDGVLRSDVAASPSGYAHQLGDQVAGVGDLDGDGLGDLLIGAPSPDCGNCPEPGQALLTIGPWSGEKLPSDAAARFVGRDRTDRFGAWVGALGDVTGDGEPDFGIAAPDMAATESESGAVFVWSGPQSGEPDLESADLVILGMSYGAGITAPSALRANADASLDLVIPRFPSGNGSIAVFRGPFGPTLDASAREDAVFVGRQSGYRPSFTGVGDLDGDGVDELVVGIGNSGPGGVLIYEGPHAGTRDLDPADADAAVLGVEPTHNLGRVFAVGDLDGDGRAELVIGSDGASSVHSAGGEVWVFTGPVVGTLEPADAAVTFASGEVGQRLGQSVDVVGDLDGDGSPDLALGETTGVLVMTGPFLPGAVAAREDAALTLENDVVEYLDLRPGRVAGAGDVDGDGFGDLLIGVPREEGVHDLTGAAHLVLLRF